MTQKNPQTAVESICPEIAPEIRRDFLSRMDGDYFSLFSPEEIAVHLRMSCELGREQPVRLKVIPRGDDRFDIVVVAYDYFSEFSIVCGLLSSFGLDIQAGHSYTFVPKAAAATPDRTPERSNISRSRVPRRISPAGSSLQKIVDVFNVRARRGFDASGQKEFERELQVLIRLLAEDKFQEARERLNRQLIEHLEKIKTPLANRLYPVDVRFENALSGKWTVMDVRSKDTPAFLYAFSNALSMRGIYIYKVHIQGVGAEARDRFYISDRQGRRIDGKREQEALRAAVVLIKQFTHFLRSAPDPARAMRHFDQLLDKILETGEGNRAITAFSLFGKEEGLNLLARLLGTSDFLWEDFLRMQFESLVPVLEDLKKRKLRAGKNAVRKKLSAVLARAEGFEEKKTALNEFKDREMFFVDMKHLIEPKAVFTEFSGALTDLAEVVLDEACRICNEHLIERYGSPVLKNGEVSAFSICGLGKFGGREMGYASDIEVLFIYGGPGQTRGPDPIDNSDYFEHLAQELVSFVEARQEGIFHLDLRLRPYGTKGTLANPIERLKTYYSPGGEAAPFERQALIKLRRVAGDGPLGRKMEMHRDHYVYSGGYWSLEEALYLRGRQMNELVEPGRVNVKYSAGGIIDVEYAVQYLQILHGKNRAGLRVPSTLEALGRLRRFKIVSKEEYDGLHDGYIFLRALIDAMRIVRGNARDLVLPEDSSEEFKFLARRMGYRQPDWEESAKRLAADIRRHMKKVHRFFAGRFGMRPTRREGVEL